MTDGTRMAVDFYRPTVFRLFYDPQGGIIRNPQANPPAEILTVNPRLEATRQCHRDRQSSDNHHSHACRKP